ncbi:MAG: sugar transferase [Anaerolineales bacterium]|nr:sugar transferase [Anaerolineales bacterium]
MGLLALTPLFLLIAFWIKKDSPGPVFYWGRRMGRGGREFRILKFRTMYETPASHAGPKVTAQGDRRITPVGEWLRATKLNELPQLWNVLIGEMSLVGPRPEDPDIVHRWPEDAQRELLSVRPGITSPASVVYRDEESMLKGENVMDDYLRSILPTKLRFDQVYVRNRNLLSDLDVIFLTFVVLIPQARREKIPEQRLYWGPLSVFFNYDLRWFVVDFFVALISVSLVGFLWRNFAPLHIGWQYAPTIAFLMSMVFGLSNALRGLNRVFWSKASPSDTLDLLFSTGVAIAVLWLSNRVIFTTPMVPTWRSFELTSNLMRSASLL